LANETTRYSRNPDFIFRKIVDELVLVPVRQNVADMDSIYTMNAVGAFVWEHLDAALTQAELVSAITERFDAMPDIVASDLVTFLGEMAAIGAVHEA
jgi:hypothetical protein